MKRSSVDVVLRKSVVRLWRQAPHSRPVSATDNQRASGKSEVRAAWPACDARKIGARSSRATRDRSFQIASEAVRAQKQRQRGAIEVQSFESKTVLWKIKSGQEHCR